MNVPTRNAIAIAVLLGVASGCGGIGDATGGKIPGPGPGAGPGPGPVAHTITGTAVDGRVSNGSGFYYEILADGTQNQRGTIKTNGRGEYEITLPLNFVGPLRLVLTQGSYTDAATGLTAQLDATTTPPNILEAIAFATGTGSLTVHMTPFTTIASLVLKDATATATQAVVEAMNDAIGQAFGLPDITGTQPLDLTDPTDAANFDPTKPETQYALLTGALAQVGQATSTLATDTLTTAQIAIKFAEDASDGVIDGQTTDDQGNTQPVVGLEVDSATEGLSDAITTFLEQQFVDSTIAQATGQAVDLLNQSIQELQVQVNQASGTVALPPVPDAPTPTSIKVLGLYQDIFINADVFSKVQVDVDLPAGALIGDTVLLKIMDTALQESTLESPALAASGTTTVSFSPINVLPFVPGELQFVARLRRPGKPASNGVSTNVKKDMRPPTVTITAPPAGFVGKTTVPIAVRAFDLTPSGAEAEFRVSEVEISVTQGGQRTVLSKDLFAPFDDTFPPSAFADGPAVITAKATDRAGNVASANVQINIDKTDPAITATELPDGAVVRALTSVWFDAVDFGSGIDVRPNFTQVSVTFDAGSGPQPLTNPTDFTVTTTDTGGGTARTKIDIKAGAQKDGTYKITVTHKDKVGNSHTAPALTVIASSQAPIVTATSVGGTARKSGDAVNGLGKVTFSLAAVLHQVDETGTTVGIVRQIGTQTQTLVLNTHFTRDNTVADEVSVTITDSKEGKYTFTVTPKDTAPTTGSPYTISLFDDRTAPTVDNVSLADNATVKVLGQIAFTLSDQGGGVDRLATAGTVAVTRGGAGLTAGTHFTVDTTTANKVTVRFTPPADGVHVVSVTPTDKAGNAPGAATQRTITADNAPPQVTSAIAEFDAFKDLKGTAVDFLLQDGLAGVEGADADVIVMFVDATGMPKLLAKDTDYTRTDVTGKVTITLNKPEDPADAGKLAQGMVDFKVTPKDKAGNIADTFRRRVFVDRTKPTVGGAMPKDGARVPEVSTVTFDLQDAPTVGSGIDPNGFVITVKRDNATLIEHTHYIASFFSTTLKLNLVILDRADGAYEIKVTPKDRAQNQGQLFTLNLTDDSKPPAADSSNPIADATKVAVDTNVTVTFTEKMNEGSVAAAFKIETGGSSVPGQLTFSTDGKTATFDPTNDLGSEKTYTVTVTDQATDLTGNHLASHYVFTFTTLDSTKPTVVANSEVPQNGATGVFKNTDVQVTFSEDMDPNTIYGATFTLEETGGTLVTGTVTYDSDRRTAKFTPNDPLLSPKSYTARVTTAVADLAGLTMATEFTFAFTTIDDIAPSVVTTNPLPGVKKVPATVTVAITFSKDMDETSLKAAGTVTMKVASGPNANTPVTGTVQTPTATTATFAPAQPLASLTTYLVTVTNAAQDTSAQQNPLVQGYLFTFTTADTARPTVTHNAPANGAAGVSVTTAVTVTFSEDMVETTVAPNVTLEDPNGDPVAGSVVYHGPSRTGTFLPGDRLASRATYKATVTTGATDLAGNTLAAPFEFTFTTRDVDGPEITAHTPGKDATSVPVTTHVTVTFNEAVVVDLNKVSSFTVTRMVGSDQLPVNGLRSYDPTSKTLTFAPGLDLLSRTEYTVTLTTAITDVAGNALPATFVFKFTTADAGAPGVLTNFPVIGQQNVTLGTNVTVTFTEAMAPQTIGTQTFTLNHGTPPTAVTGQVTYDTATFTATFDPNQDLLSSTEYTATVTTGATDASGNALSAPFTFRFTTKDETPPTGTITAPAGGTTLHGTTLAVMATANDNFGVAHVVFSVTDGVTTVLSPQITSVPGVPYSGVIDTTPLTDGPATIRLTVVDQAGNKAENVDSIAVTIDNHPPVIGDITPAAAPVKQLPQFTMTVAATSAGARLHKADFYLGSESGTLLATVDKGHPYAYTFSAQIGPAHLGFGNNTVVVVVSDDRNHTVSASRTFFVDNEVPTAVYAPTEGPLNSLTTVTITMVDGTGGGNAGIDATASLATLSATFNTNTQLTVATQTQTSGNQLVLTLTPTLQGDGVYDFSIRPVDLLGNQATPAITAKYTLDTVPPTGQITAPQQNDLVGVGQNLAATANDNVGLGTVTFSLTDGANTVTAGPVTSTTNDFSTTIDPSSLQDGPATLTLAVTDAAGNTTVSAHWINVTIETSPPVIVSTTPAAGRYGPKITMNVQATDAALNRAQFHLDGATGTQLISVQTGDPNNFTFTADLDLSAASFGNHTIFVRVFDNGQNETQTSVTYFIDNQAPSA
ncbi:Ig-like domain-containing protein, partial [Planctomycetota bacterium]